MTGLAVGAIVVGRGGSVPGGGFVNPANQTKNFSLHFIKTSQDKSPLTVPTNYSTKYYK